MGAKYRLDREGPAEPNGTIPVFTDWAYGPTLAAVRHCNGRTAYVAGKADIFFSIPAYQEVKGKRVLGWLEKDETGYTFHANSGMI